MRGLRALGIIIAVNFLGFSSTVWAAQISAEKLVNHLLTPETIKVAEAIALELEGISVNADTSTGVTFNKAGSVGFPNEQLRDGNFRLLHVKINTKSDDQGATWITGTLLHGDSLERRQRSSFSTLYKADSDGKINISEAFTWPLQLLTPRVHYFFVPKEAGLIRFLESKPSNRDVFKFLGGKAIEINGDLTLFSASRSYYIVAAVMDYVGASSQLTLRSSKSAQGLKGKPMKSRSFKRDGFPIVVAPAKIAFGKGAEVFYKTIMMAVGPSNDAAFAPTVVAAASSFGRYPAPPALKPALLIRGSFDAPRVLPKRIVLSAEKAMTLKKNSTIRDAPSAKGQRLITTKENKTVTVISHTVDGQWAALGRGRRVIAYVHTSLLEEIAPN